MPIKTYYTERLNNKLMILNSSLDQKVKARTEQLRELNAKLEHQVNIDALTGAFNRRALNDQIQQQFILSATSTQYTDFCHARCRLF